ncbi:hypothetical protein LDENG_00036610 [Lucifuga dentata]|nr:hypothetical protein LDENG_00036610 [Lucifuga dentata]
MWTLLLLCSVITSHGAEAYTVWPPYTSARTTEPTATATPPSCRNNCGKYLGSCSCTSSCQRNGNCCYDFNYECYYYHTTTVRPITTVSYTTTTSPPTPGQPSCRYNCGYHMGSCSCSSSCRYNGSCCHDYYYQCPYTTIPSLSTTGRPSCRYNCGYHMGSCSCSRSCEYNGNCCHDYYSYCPTTTTTLPSTTAPCGGVLYNREGNFTSPNYPGNYPHYADCIWYIRPGTKIIKLEIMDIQLECGYDYIRVYDGYSTSSRLLGALCMGNGTFYSTSNYLTVRFTSDASVSSWGFKANYSIVAGGSCRYNCGYQVGNCSCSSSCLYYGNCCPDFTVFCPTPAPSTSPPTTGQPSCRYNCGYHMGSCSCLSSCRYNGSCCHDYYSYCPTTTPSSTTAPCGGILYSREGNFTSPNYPGNYSHYADCVWYIRPGTKIIKLEITDIQLECGYDYFRVYDGYSTTGRLLGSLCSRNSIFYSTGYYLTVHFTSDAIVAYRGFQAKYSIVAGGSCRYNCGYQVGNCSCSSSCSYYGSCCADYTVYCRTTPVPPTTGQPSCRYNCGYHMGSCSCSSSCPYNGNCCYDYSYYCHNTAVPTTPAQPSCRYNCGRHLGSCSCSSSCQYNGNCCHDFYRFCPVTTPSPAPCGGSLYGSGSFTSPFHPNHYQDNMYCLWYISSALDERIYLSFSYLQLENCCSCDYIAVYDGPSVSSRYLGKVCNSTLNSFYSTSRYMTVLFRTDSSVVGRGFRADFTGSLPPSSGRVDCSYDNMDIVIEKSYLNSLGYNGYDLYLNDQYCRPQIFRYQVIFRFPVNTCGTIRKFENGRVVYTNTVRAYASASGVITRQSFLKLNVGCRMEPDTMAQLMYVAHHHDNGSITGTGRFNATMAFYTSSNFYYQVTEVPYEVTLNQHMYVQMNLRRGDSSLVLFLDTCVASPSPHDFHTKSYYLVRNGCSMDHTYYSYVSGSRSYARFTFKAFQFLRAADSVYLQCRVIICPQSDYNSRCRQGCRSRIARDLGTEHNSETLVLGPIRLKPELEKQEEGTHNKEDKA